MSYVKTMIRVAPDSPTQTALIPTMKDGQKTVAFLEYELLINQPYTYTQDKAQFAVHAMHKNIPNTELETHLIDLYAEFIAKPRACFRASALPKQYGWGVHYDDQGRIALYAVNSPEYQRLTQLEGIKQLVAMRSSRAA
jgi:Family of unknown function (DUF6157)